MLLRGIKTLESNIELSKHTEKKLKNKEDNVKNAYNLCFFEECKCIQNYSK